MQAQEHPDVSEVVLCEYPLALGAEGEEHQDTLLREFQLLVLGEEHGHHSAPRRLLELAHELVERYGAELEGPRRQRDEALARGEVHCDVVYLAPPETAEVIARWDETYRLVDEYCEEGALLTLATPPRLLAMREWTFSEFRRQIGGHAPTPWPQWEAEHSQPG